MLLLIIGYLTFRLNCKGNASVREMWPKGREAVEQMKTCEEIVN